MRPAYELAGRPGASCLQVGRASPGVFATSQPDATRHPAYELAGAARRPAYELAGSPGVLLTSWPAMAWRRAYELAGRRPTSCLRVGWTPRGVLLASWSDAARHPAHELAGGITASCLRVSRAWHLGRGLASAGVGLLR